MNYLRGLLPSESRLKAGIIVLIIIMAMVMSTAILAQDNSAQLQTFTAYYGAMGPGNIAVYAFAPTDLKVHRGDRVTWILDAESNVHFEDERIPLFIGSEVNGQQMPIFNPAAAFPTIESGAVYTGGDVNSGMMGLVSMDQGLKSFSLIVDLEPGTYTYFCDVHVRSATITVVPDNEPIPSPAEVSEMAALQLENAIEQGIIALADKQIEMAGQAPSSDNRVLMGLKTGDTYVRQFFPPFTIIKAGESVTWEVPAGHHDSHTVTWPPMALGQVVVPVDVEGDTPVYTLGPVLRPMAESGVTVKNGQAFNGVVGDGGSYTITFDEPGVYPYVDNLHAPGMAGVVIVMSAD
jgi:plastocyanin